jgi:coproporphyrinogen III oxidase-like Fe-S oxidoreductase
MIELNKFLPINIDFVKKERDKIYNIPNNDWKAIKRDLEIINDITIPHTLRLYMLNHLPYCVIEIMQEMYN